MKSYLCCKCGGCIYPGQSYSSVKNGKIHLSPECEKAKAVSVPAPTVPEEEAKFRSNYLPRKLGSRVGRSKIERECYHIHSADISVDHHLSFIYPGEEYLREVWLMPVGEPWEKKTRIEVRFSHYPQCPYDDGYKNMGAGVVVQMRKKSGSKNSSLKKAA